MHCMVEKLANVWYQLSIYLRYLIVGAFNTAFSYAIYVALIFGMGAAEYHLALVLSYAISSIFSFSLQKVLVFQSTHNFFVGYLRGLLSWGTTYCLNALILEWLVAKMHFSQILGQLIAIGITTVFTFLLFKFFVFAKKWS